MITLHTGTYMYIYTYMQCHAYFSNTIATNPMLNRMQATLPNPAERQVALVHIYVEIRMKEV